MKVAAVLVALLPLACSGCLLVMAVPPMIDEYGWAGPETSGVEYYRHDGQTPGGEPYRIRHFLDPAAKRRHILVSVSGKVFKSGSEDFSGAISAARAACGTVCDAGTEAEVKARLGQPTATSLAENVHVLWYVRSRDQVLALIFQNGRFVTAFQTDQTEMDEMLVRPSPYS
jgi:hypothetical protein